MNVFYVSHRPQEKLIDLESELEELSDSEQRWAAKQKRAIEQVAGNDRAGKTSRHKTGRQPLLSSLFSDRAAAAEADPGERSQRPAGDGEDLHGETGESSRPGGPACPRRRRRLCSRFCVSVQLRELRMEVEDLRSSRVQEDVVSRAETRAKELESALRAEERWAAPLTSRRSFHRLVCRVLMLVLMFPQEQSDSDQHHR